MLNETDRNIGQFRNDSDPVRSETSKDPLQQVIQEYKTGLQTPELITNFWQIFIQTSVKQAGLNRDLPAIPNCDRTQEELEVLRKGGREMVYNPGFEYPILGKIFRKMQSDSVKEDSPIKDEYERVGWVDVEMSLDTLNRDTSEDQLRDLFSSQGRDGQRLSTYIWASQASKVLTGHFLDEKTYSRLFGSRGRYNNIVSAYFGSDGLLRVSWDYNPEDHSPGLGGRSEGVKRT